MFLVRIEDAGGKFVQYVGKACGYDLAKKIAIDLNCFFASSNIRAVAKAVEIPS